MYFFCQKVWFELASFIHIYNIYLQVYIYICCLSYGNSFFFIRDTYFF